MTRRRRSRSPRCLVVAAAALAAALVAATDSDAAGTWELRSVEPVADGMTLSEHARSDPLRAMVLQVAAGAPASVSVVVSSDRVDGGRETVSSMCHRAGAVACVNAHFATCPTCGQPAGSIVRDGVLVRTRTDDHFDDVSVIDGRLTLERWSWSLRLHSPSLLPLESPAEVAIDGVNVRARSDGIVAYTPDYGPRTPEAPGTYALVLRAPEPLRTGPDVRQPVSLLGSDRDGATPIPPGGMALAGSGTGADRLRRFAADHASDPVELRSHTPAGLQHTVAGHPVLLRDGQPVALDRTADRHLVRHPRTVIGWDRAGTIWLVVVDGRQVTSRGIGLADVAAQLRALGATEAVNLDGGGSSTLVTRCPHSVQLCLRNRPSDGRERAVPVALAIHGTFLPAPPRPSPSTTAVPAPPAVAATVPDLATTQGAPAGATLADAVGTAAAPSPDPTDMARDPTSTSATAPYGPSARVSRDAGTSGLAIGIGERSGAPAPDGAGRGALAVLAALAVAVDATALHRLRAATLGRSASTQGSAGLTGS